MLEVRVKNMTSHNGNKIPNQFIIETDIDPLSGHCTEYFQSYNTIIAKREPPTFMSKIHNGKVTLDPKWDYSKTTGKYRNIFLDENKKQTQQKIDSSIYVVCDLNK